jgi:hypothetical protein
LAAGAFYAPMNAAATSWFVDNRALAVSLVSGGHGGCADDGLAVGAVADLELRLAHGDDDHRHRRLDPAAAGRAAGAPAPDCGRRRRVRTQDAAQAAGMSAVQALRTPQFAILAATFFARCAARSGPIFHMVSYAIGCGVPAMAAVSIYSLEGLSGLGGRLLRGVLADRLGAKRVLVAGLLVQALAIGPYLFVGRLGEFYALSAIYGIAYGGVTPLYAVLARKYFGARFMGTVFGAATMASSLGMASVRWPAAGCSTPSATTPGSMSPHSVSA